MRLEELQMATNRAWHIHLMRCTLIALILVVVPIYSVNGFNIFWGIGSFLIAAYAAEWTRHEWRQLQAIRKLRCFPATSELRIAKAKDKLHHSILNAVLLCCVFVLIAYMLRGIRFSGLSSGLLIWPCMALGSVLKAWGELRQVTD